MLFLFLTTTRNIDRPNIVDNNCIKHVSPFSAGTDLNTSEADVHRRHILTSGVGPCTEIIKDSQ